VGDDRAFTLTGPTDPARAAVLHFANPLTVAPVLELNDADFMTVAHLTLQGGQIGLGAHNTSRGLTLNSGNESGNSQDGVRVEGGSDVLDAGNVTAFNNKRYGIYVDGPLGRLHDSAATFNGDTGIFLNNTGSTAVEANESGFNQGYGIFVADSS